MHPRLNVVQGRNGQGKTNFIEGIALLSQARSFRTAQLSELVRWGEHSMSVFAQVQHAQSDLALGLSVESGTRSLYINGDKVGSLAKYLGHLPTVTFTPDDIVLVKGGPQERRRFLDRHLADLDRAVLPHMLAYQRALRHKNSLLKQPYVDSAALEPWNTLMAESAERVMRARRWLTQHLEQRAALLQRRIAPGDGELTLTLRESLDGGDLEATRILRQLSAATARERAARTSLIGPHRDDLEIALGGRDARAYASQGQARSVVLILKLAVIELIEEMTGESPVILLDDVDAELDERRSEEFFREALIKDRQTLVTGTEGGERLAGGSDDFLLLHVDKGVTRQTSC